MRVRVGVVRRQGMLARVWWLACGGGCLSPPSGGGGRLLTSLTAPWLASSDVLAPCWQWRNKFIKHREMGEQKKVEIPFPFYRDSITLFQARYVCAMCA